MGKRKADEAGLPHTVRQEPAPVAGTGPFVVYFPSRFEPEGDVACEWQAYAHQRKNQYTVVARTKNQVDFVGSTSSAEYSTQLPCRYALGMFSRSSGQLQLMPAEGGGRVLRLEPRVHGLSYEARDTTTAIEPGKLKAANMRLVEEFGSQRRKRQLKAREAGKVEAQHVSAAQAVLGMIASVGEAAGVTKEGVIQASLAQRNIPPHNPGARVAAEAYPADRLVPPALADALEITKLFPAANKPEYRDTLRGSGMFGEGYVLTRLPVLATQDKGAREERARMLALLGHLLKLNARWGVMKAGQGGLEELAEKVKAAPSVLEGLLDLFYTEEAGFEGSRYLLTKEKRSLMLGYILVLAVRLEPRCTLEPEHFQALCEELKQRPTEVVQRYRELGCVDVPVSAASAEGTRTRSYRISLMPESAEEKTLADYFPALKLGGKKR